MNLLNEELRALRTQREIYVNKIADYYNTLNKDLPMEDADDIQSKIGRLEKRCKNNRP